MHRVVRPELLDELPPADPRAIRSRADLRRMNFLLGHAGILSRESLRRLDKALLRSRPLRLVELGAGDGSLLLRLARRWAAQGVTAQVTLLDRHALVSEKTRHAFAALDWSLEIVTADVFTWLQQPSPMADVMFANLFLHHFLNDQLATLLRLSAARTNLFVACEPRRSRRAIFASHFLWLAGCNTVSRHDGVLSTRAGFADRELSALWPPNVPWKLREEPAGLFSHCFVAKRSD